MIIDLILDRSGLFDKNCQNPYDPQQFAEEVREYAETFDDDPTQRAIVQALESGCEQRVRHALCGYVLANGYAPEICDYINSVGWLPDWWELP